MMQKNARKIKKKAKFSRVIFEINTVSPSHPMYVCTLIILLTYVFAYISVNNINNDN